MFIWQISSGICRCGHSWEHHHGNIIMNQETLNKLPLDHPPILPGECEYHGASEFNDGHCKGYFDKDFESFCI